MHEVMNPRVPGLGLAPAMASRDAVRRPDALLDDQLVGDEIRAAGADAARAIGATVRREARRLESFRSRQRPAWAR